jgi:oligosaccharide repeat unit polymerase
LLVTLLTFSLLLQRFNFFFGAIITTAFLYYSSRFLTIKRITIVTLIFFGFLGIIQTIRLSQYVSQYIYVISKMKFSKEYAFFAEPYMYISMNLENMARASDKLENYLYGASTFDWLTALFGLKHWMADYFNIEARPFLISGYNTFPFHFHYYYDLGLIGLFLFPLIIGYLIGTFYNMMKLTGDIKWVVMYSICVAIIVLSFFTNPLTMLSSVFNIFVLWLIHHFFINQKYKPRKTN